MVYVPYKISVENKIGRSIVGETRGEELVVSSVFVVLEMGGICMVDLSTNASSHVTPILKA